MGDPTIQAGDYRFRGPLTTAQVLDKLVEGRIVTHSVTLIEGLTLRRSPASSPGRSSAAARSSSTSCARRG